MSPIRASHSDVLAIELGVSVALLGLSLLLPRRARADAFSAG